MSVQNLKLSDIDSTVIAPIRAVDTDSTGYKKLKSAIAKDGQLHPITVRRLTEDEKQQTDNNAEYGIIDGQHRFQIAQSNGQDTISAEVYECEDDDQTSAYRDIAMAYRLNEATIKMSSLDKGKVIYDLLEQSKGEGSGKTASRKEVSEIGEEVFGLKKSMSYAALRKYKEAQGMETIEKPRDSAFAIEKFQETLSELPQTQEDLDDSQKRTQQLKAVKDAQKQLKQLKKFLSAT